MALAALLWASTGTVGKMLFNNGMSPAELVQARTTLSALVLIIFYAPFARKKLSIRIKDIPYFLALGSGAMAMVQITYFYAISKIQVAAAILLEYLAPGLVALFSIFYLKEKLVRFKVL